MSETGFWWVLAATGLYGVVHSILAANRVKAWAARAFGEAAYRRWYRLFFVIAAVPTLLPALALAALLPDRTIYTIPAPWLYLTLAVQAAAALGILAGVMQTGASRFLGFAQMADPSGAAGPETLVVSGLYRLTRHPLYTFSFLFIWLVPVMTWNILALNTGLSLYMLIGSIFEERKLVEQFGQSYEQYRASTPRLIPRIGKAPRK